MMKTLFRRILLMMFAAMLAGGAALAETDMEHALPSLPLTDEQIAPLPALKGLYCGNPISAEIFCADPTAVEYEGRLYVYATNDHQQYLEKGADAENTYERIKSFVIFSTEDLVNWTYHGIIDTAKIAPWIWASWAPSVISRVEEDGLTHFYLYFSNSGAGVGVLTATHPLGPWTDPLGYPLISARTPGLLNVPQPFDPGAAIDENGTGWLAFGGGVAPGGTDAMPGTARIVRLGKDLISVDSPFVEIKAPYFFEASELNVIGDTFVYTYCTNWKERKNWQGETPVPTTACMAYMTTKTPLESDSWVYRGECFKNPGLSGFDYSNNHTHMHKYRGRWFMIYHTMALKAAMGIKGGYRSLCVGALAVDEETAAIKPSGGNRNGPGAIATVSPFSPQSIASHDNSAGVRWDASGAAVSEQRGSWVKVSQVDFGEGEKELAFYALLSGKGQLEVRLDKPAGKRLAAAAFDCPDQTTVSALTEQAVSGVHDLYFLFSGGEIALSSWQFAQ